MVKMPFWPLTLAVCSCQTVRADAVANADCAGHANTFRAENTIPVKGKWEQTEFGSLK